MKAAHQAASRSWRVVSRLPGPSIGSANGSASRFWSSSWTHILSAVVTTTWRSLIWAHSTWRLGSALLQARQELHPLRHRLFVFIVSLFSVLHCWQRDERYWQTCAGIVEEAAALAVN